MPVCSEMGVNQPMDSIGGTAETITLVPEDLVRGVNSVAGAHSEVATLWNQCSCGTTSGGTYVQNSIMVTMLGDALWTVNAGMQHSDPATRVNDSIVPVPAAAYPATQVIKCRKCGVATKDSRPRDPSLPGTKVCSSVSKAGGQER